MFKCVIKIDEKTLKDINRNAWVLSLILTIVGAIGLLLYIVIGMFFDNIILEATLWISAIVFAGGLVYMFLINQTNKKNGQQNIINEMQIYEDNIFVRAIKNNEEISTQKFYFKDIYKIKENEKYFILYINKFTALPILKESFSKEDMATIKVWVYSAKKDLIK